MGSLGFLQHPNLQLFKADKISRKAAKFLILIDMGSCSQNR